MNRFAIPIMTLALFGASSAFAAEPTKDECITANETAQDLRQAGKLREARRNLAFCVAAGCPRMLREDCAQRLTEVDKSMPTLVIVAKDGAGNDLTAVRVTMDGELLAEKLDEKPIAVDPGEHRFAFEAVGLRTTERTLVIREGDRNRLEQAVLGPIFASPAPAGAEASQHSLFATVPAPSYVAFGVGVVGLAVGTVAGFVAMGDHSTLQKQCTPSCPPGDLGAFHTAADLSTVSFVVGAIGVVGGGVLWITLHKESTDARTAHAWVGPGFAGVAGSF